MNKTELVKAIAAKAKLKLSDTEKLVNAFMETVSEELKGKGKVTLVGFGTFKVAHRKQKVGVNPKTGAKITIRAKDVPIFNASEALLMKQHGPHRSLEPNGTCAPHGPH